MVDEHCMNVIVFSLVKLGAVTVLCLGYCMDGLGAIPIKNKN